MKLITGPVAALALLLPGAALADHAASISVSAGDAVNLTADNEFDLYVDGSFVGSSDNWPTGATYALTLAPGQHVIAVRTANYEDLFHGGWIADVALDNGDHVLTDGDWRWTATPPADWTQLSADDSTWSFAQVKGPFGMAPWGSQPAIMSGTDAYWIGTRSDTFEPAGDIYYRRVFTVTVPDCPAGAPIDPSVVCNCPEGTTDTTSGTGQRVCEPVMEEDGDPAPQEEQVVLCRPQPTACACIAVASRTNPGNLCTCPAGSTYDPSTLSCTCPEGTTCNTCPEGQQLNSAGACECARVSDPNGCDPAAPIDDCPPDVLCPDTYESVFEPFMLHGGLAVHQCGTPEGFFRPSSGGWVATVNTNFTAAQLGSGANSSDNHLAEPIIENDEYAMLLQRHYSDPAQLVDYRIDHADYFYQGGTRRLTIQRPAPEENPPGIPGTTFRSPDGLTAATIDKEIDLTQSDLVSVRYNVSIQAMPYDRISGLRFHASAGGIDGRFVSLTRINGNVPGGVDPATVAGHVYQTNSANQETVTGELLLPRGHLYTIDNAFVEFMDLQGVRLNEVKVKRPLSVVTDAAGNEDTTRDPEAFTVDLRSFDGCQVDVYVRISKPAGRILGELYLEPAPSALPPAAGPRVTHYSPSYLGYRTNNTLDGERLGYFVNGAPRYILPVAGSASYDYKCIAYDRWLPAHRSNSFTARIAWQPGFGAGGGWLRWPAHGVTAMNPVDTADNQTVGLDRDGFVYLDGPSDVLLPNGSPYWPNPDPLTIDGPGLVYPAPIGPLEMFTEEIFYDTRMAYLNGHVDLSGCITTQNIVSGTVGITGLPSGVRGMFADERGFNRYEVNGAQRGLASGIFRSPVANRGDYQVVGTDGPWREGNYYLHLRRGTNPDDWQNYYNGVLHVNTNPSNTYPLEGHQTHVAPDRTYETGLVRIRMRVQNAPFSFDTAGNPIANPPLRPFRLPQAFIGGSLPAFVYGDSTGQTGRYAAHSTGSPTVQTTHYLTIIGVANSVVNISLRAQVPQNPDGTGRYFVSGFPPLLRVPIQAGESCIDVCTDAAGNQVPCAEPSCDETTVCSAPDACHTSWCDPVTQQCTSAPIDCDDGDLCTADGCDAAGGCQHAPITTGPDCAPVETACPAGCDDGNPCTVDACELDGCVYTPVTDGTVCSDGSACTVADSCQAGVCTGGAPLACDDGAECTVDVCDPAVGCVSAPAAAGTSCGSSDGSECSAADSCDGAGNCSANDAPAGAPCGDTGSECVEQDRCDGSGACVDNGFVSAGSACGDGSDGECTDPDTCSGDGVCLANDAAAGTACGDAGSACVVQDSCSGSGTCVDNGFTPDGTACSDGDACTGNDACQTGTCAGDFDTDDDGICECAAAAPGCGAGPDPCPGDTCNLCDEVMNVKPFSNPSSLNLGTQHATSVAIFGSADLDVTALDLNSLSFDVFDPSNTATIKARGNGRLQINYGDLNGDGILDVEIHFVTDGLELACIGEGVLTGGVMGCSAPLSAIHDQASDPIVVHNASGSCQ